MTEIIVALDGNDIDHLRRVHDELRDLPLLYKFGLEFAEAMGPQGLLATTIPGEKIFFDHKWADIPTTVAGAATSALAHYQPRLVNGFGPAGPSAMKALAEIVHAQGKGVSKAIAVTVLTTMDENECLATYRAGRREATLRFTQQAVDAGCDGVVTHVDHLAAIREEFGANLLTITPGIRALGDAANDQFNPATPGNAAKAGSDYLVVGRPILQPASGTRFDAARRYLDAIML